jgi:hypothetical protein
LYPFIYLKGGDYVLPRLINENLLAIAMKYHCLTDGFRYVAAGRSELGRDGAKHEQLASEYSCGSVTLTGSQNNFEPTTTAFESLRSKQPDNFTKQRGFKFLLDRYERT